MKPQEHQDIGVGPLSDALRLIVEKLAQSPDQLADKILAAMEHGIDDYQRAMATDPSQDIRESVRLNVDIWYAALLSGQPPDQSTLARLAEFGRHRVHQDVSLAGLLQAYRIGSRVIWRHLLDSAAHTPALEHEMLVNVSPYILYHFDLLGQTIGQAYGDEAQKIARWRDRLRHDLCGLIFGGSEDVQRFREYLLKLSLDDSTPHAALAFELPALDPSLNSPNPHVEAVVSGLSQHLGLDRDQFLHYRHHDHQFIWLPIIAGELPATSERRLFDVLTHVCAEQSLSGGLGLPNSGPSGWRQSAEQAQRAITLGRRLNHAAQCFRYLDVCLDDASLRDTGTSNFLQAVVERLANEGELLDTLQKFFDCRGQRKKIAAELGIHPNTLSYRLDRIETLLQLNLDDPSRQALLHTALRLRRFSELLSNEQ